MACTNFSLGVTLLFLDLNAPLRVTSSPPNPLALSQVFLISIVFRCPSKPHMSINIFSILVPYSRKVSHPISYLLWLRTGTNKPAAVIAQLTIGRSQKKGIYPRLRSLRCPRSASNVLKCYQWLQLRMRASRSLHHESSHTKTGLCCNCEGHDFWT